MELEHPAFELFDVVVIAKLSQAPAPAQLAGFS